MHLTWTHLCIGDLGVVAKHVASFADFRDTSFHDKWTDFGRRVSAFIQQGESTFTPSQFPQRAPKSWKYVALHVGRPTYTNVRLASITGGISRVGLLPHARTSADD